MDRSEDEMNDRGDIEETQLERKAERILNGLNVRYISQYPTRTGFVLDFAVFPEDGKKIDLEIDGERWHSSKRARKRDNFRSYMLRREGWQTVRIRERNFDEDFDRIKGMLYER